MASTETYADGSWCEFYDDGSGGCWDAEGNQTDSWFGDTPATTPPSDDGGGIDLTRIFSEGIRVLGGALTDTRPEYAPVYQQYPRQIPTTTRAGAYDYRSQGQPKKCNGVTIGGQFGASGEVVSAGTCVPYWAIVAGGVVTFAFFFGQRRGRRG